MSGLAGINRAFFIYPNPSQGDAQLQLTGASPEEIFTIRVLDVSGRLMQRLNLKAGDVQSIGSNLAPGIYTIEARSEHRRVVQQWVKQ